MEQAKVETGRIADSYSYVDWGAVFAGAIAALSVSFVLLSFGAAVGLSAVSPWNASSSRVTALGIGSGFWVLLVTAWSFALGGYLSARLRHRRLAASVTEANFRDNAHGLLSWSLAVVIGAMVAAVVAQPGSNGATPATAVAVDNLTRSTRVDVPVADGETRALVARVLATNVGNDRLVSRDQAFLNELVAARTGIPPNEAEQRVNAAFNEWKSSADRARKVGIVMGFLAAATLLLGAVTAWWAAGVGGQHRDEGTLWSAFERRTRITTTSA